MDGRRKAGGARRRSSARAGGPPARPGTGESDVAPPRPAFQRFAQAAARMVGRPGGFILAVLGVLVWAASGPFLGYSESWQLVINTGTTILTFLMVFLLQNSQTRDTEAIQLKLDELIRAVQGARNSMVAIDQLSDEERERLRERFTELAARARDEEPDDDSALEAEEAASATLERKR